MTQQSSSSTLSSELYGDVTCRSSIFGGSTPTASAILNVRFLEAVAMLEVTRQGAALEYRLVDLFPNLKDGIVLRRDRVRESAGYGQPVALGGGRSMVYTAGVEIRLFGVQGQHVP